MAKLDIAPAGLAVTAATCALLIAVPEASAQRPDPSTISTAPGVIAGVVVDSLARPIDGAEVGIDGMERRTTSGPDGTFRLTAVREGTHMVRARRIGFAPRSEYVRVGPDGGRVVITMRPAAPRLDPVVSSASRRGLAGVVGDTAFRPLPDVTVTVFGASGQRTVTDADGSFFLPLRRGRYMLEFSAEGRATRLLSVAIPSDSGRWMAVRMRNGAGPTTQERIDLRNLRGRLAWRSMASSKFFTREELAAWEGLPLTNIVNMGLVRPYEPYCEAFINGGQAKLPIWYFDLNELESVEVYEGHPGLPRINDPSWWPRRRIGPPLIDERQGAGRECPTVYVWLR